MMTREQFVERWRHELCGFVAAAAVDGKQHASLALWLRSTFRAIDDTLAKMYAELTQPTNGQPTNGQPRKAIQ